MLSARLSLLLLFSSNILLVPSPPPPPQPGSGLGLHLSDPDAAADDRHPHLLSAYSDREWDAWLVVRVEDSCREVASTA